MKTVNNKPRNSNLIYLLMIVSALVTFSSCARKINFQISAVVPAARGTVKVKQDDNQNYIISINLYNLSEAKRLPTSEQTYMVWMESDDQAVKNLGQINSSTKTFSNKLKASFETVSSVKPTKVFITAETNSSVQYPGNELVLTTGNFR